MAKQKKQRIFLIYLFLILIYIAFFKIYNINFLDFSNTFYSYFGIFIYLLVFDISSDIFIGFKKSKFQRFRSRIRLIFFNIFILSTSLLVVFKYAEYFSNLSPTKLIQTSLNHLNMGFIFANGISYLYKTYDYVLTIMVLQLISFISFLFFGVHLISQIMKKYKKDPALKKLNDERAELQEKINIKEALINEEEDEYKKMNQAQEINIREKLYEIPIEKANIQEENSLSEEERVREKLLQMKDLYEEEENTQENPFVNLGNSNKNLDETSGEKTFISKDTFIKIETDDAVILETIHEEIIATSSNEKEEESKVETSKTTFDESDLAREIRRRYEEATKGGNK